MRSGVQLLLSMRKGIRKSTYIQLKVELKEIMKRRDLIKTGLLGLSAGALISGCNKEATENITDSSELKITPKQTGTYEFSCPLPFNYKTIDEIVELNKSLTKSKVTTLYNSIPNPLGKKFNRWIHIERGQNTDIKSYDDFFKYVDYAKSKGFEFVYLMNSPKPFSQKDFFTFKDELSKLLDLLIKHDIRNIKVANNQVAELINDYLENPDYFNLSASCAFEFHNIEQYNHLLNNYPNFNLIDLTYDENQNFKLLSSLKKRFPKIKLELMVNEQCIKFCPARISHVSEESFARFQCHTRNLGSLKYFAQLSYIYPWDLEYYSSLGINNFKFTAIGLNRQGRNNFKDISAMKYYLDIVENGIKDYTVKDLQSIFHASILQSDKDLKLSDIKSLFPDIRYFIAHGHECSYKCGVDCNYCYECAKKLEKVLLYG